MTQNYDELLKRLKHRSRRQWVGSVQGMEDFPDEDCVNAAAIIDEQAAAIRELQSERDAIYTKMVNAGKELIIAHAATRAAYNQAIEDAADVVNSEIPATQEYSQRFSILSSAEDAIRQLKRTT